MAKDQSQNC